MLPNLFGRALVEQLSLRVGTIDIHRHCCGCGNGSIGGGCGWRHGYDHGRIDQCCAKHNTNASGRYTYVDVNPGTYNMAVSKWDFQP